MRRDETGLARPRGLLLASAACAAVMAAAIGPAAAQCTATPAPGDAVTCTGSVPDQAVIGGGITYADPIFLTLDGTTNGPIAIGAPGLPVSNGGAVIVSSGATSRIVTTGVVGIHTQGDDNYGVAILSDSAGTIAIGAGTVITTNGVLAFGVYADGSAPMTVSVAGDVTTNGPLSVGVGARGNGTVTVSVSGNVTTNADIGVGVLARDSGIDPTTVTLTVSGTVITNGSQGAYGAYAAITVGAGLASITLERGASIGTAGNTSFGAFADSLSGGDARISNAGTITTGGEDSHAAWVRIFSGTGQALVINSGSVTTAGLRASGLEAAVESGASGDATIRNTGRVATAGEEAIGIQARSEGGNAVVTQDGTVTTTGTSAYGILANASGAATVTSTGITTTTGTGAHGIMVEATGSARVVSSGTITASGAAASGISIARADGGYTVDVTAGTITGGGIGPGTGAGISIGAAAGGSIAIAAGATVTASSGWAIQDAEGAMLLTSRGAILGNISAGGGNDQVFLEAGSRTAGLVYLGAGDDRALVRPGADIAGVTLFDGEGGSDMLRFEGVTRTGGADIVNWERFELAQGSRFTLGSDLVMGSAGSVGIEAGSVLLAPGNRSIGTADASPVTVTNAGLIAIATGSTVGNSLTIAGHYVGQGGIVTLNTVLGGSGTASDRLVITGGRASGVTGLRIANIGGDGAPGVQEIRLVETRGGATTDPGAFRLDSRVATGSFEYQLFRGGSASAEDWFLRSADAAGVPLYRPEAALYAPAPAAARRIGLATLATLDARVGEGLDGLADGVLGKEAGPPGSGAWARVIGERSRSRWDGTVDAAATANLIGLQAGFDILRAEPYAGGHRDHAGVYVAYTDYSAPSVSGFALGQQGLRIGRLQMGGPAVGAYWTHFGPAGWYLNAVVQANWFDATARSDYGAGLSTNGTGAAASLEAGSPIRFGQGWQIEPQAQIVWQSVSVDRSRDIFSTVAWDEGDAVTGRLGARVQYTGRSAEALWQPYVKANLWHGFSGTDRTVLGASAPIESRYGDTALEVGAGITARVSRTASVYAHADYRWSLDGGRGRQTATQGSVGIRVNW